MALAPLHRSRTNVPMRERLHLHDGLRLMTAVPPPPVHATTNLNPQPRKLSEKPDSLTHQDIAREHGWHLPHKSTADITRSTDELEDALYKAHDYAFRCAPTECCDICLQT